MQRIIKNALSLLIAGVVLVVLYTGIVTLLGQLFFNQQANGSLVKDQTGQVVGSSLIGQAFTDEKYLWGRQMLIDDTSFKDEQGQPVMYAFNSNLSQKSPKLVQQVKQRASEIAALNNDKTPVPVDLVTTSGSGLDPEISVAAANYQVERIAQARKIAPQQVQQVIKQNTKDKVFGILGTKRVNVLAVNLALDRLTEK